MATIRPAPTAAPTKITSTGSFNDSTPAVSPNVAATASPSTGATTLDSTSASTTAQPTSGASRIAASPSSQTEANTGNTGTPATAAPATTTPADADVIAGMKSGDWFFPNIMNNYSNWAYHWKFYTTGDQDILNKNGVPKDLGTIFTTLDDISTVVVAETGLTTYDITDVTMEANIGPNFQTRGDNITGITMTIKEPNGISFLDALGAAANNLNVRNYQQVWYYLELTFKGYRGDSSDGGDYQEGAIVDQIGDDIPNGGRWIWSVAITNIDVDMGPSGGVYTLALIPHSQRVITNEYGSVPETIVATGDNVGDMFKSFADGLNKSWGIRLGDPKNKVIKYRFKFHPITGRAITDLSKLKLTPKEKGYNYERNLSLDDEDGMPTMHVPRGTQISDVIDMVFSNSEDAQKLAKDSAADDNSPDDSGDKVNDKGYRETMIFRGKPDVISRGFDAITNTYYKDISWNIYGYETQNVILSKTQIDEAQKQPTQEAMIATLGRKNMLRKRYEYLFTGLNTEVINFDLKFNMAYTANFPRLQFYNNEQSVTHAKANTNTHDFTDLLDKMRQAEDDYEKSIDKEEQVKADTGSTPAQQASAHKRTVVAQKRLQTLSDQLDQARTATEATTNTLTPAPQAGKRFAEDLTEQTAAIKIAIGVSEVEEPRDQTGAGMIGQYHPGKTIYGAILNQTYGMETSQFQIVDVQIQGDPYWIGAGSYETMIADHNDTPLSEHYPDYDRGPSHFLIQFRYPVRMDENAAPVFSQSEIFSGVYQVVTVSHSFKSGQFTQSLHANRISLIEPSKSLGTSKNTDAVAATSTNTTAGSNNTTPPTD